MRLFLCLLLLPGFAHAASVIAESATARPSYGRTAVGAAYLRLRNDQATADTLLSAESPMARRIELHDTQIKHDIMRMVKIDTLPLPPHGTAELKPGGAHLMLFDLQKPLSKGMHFPLTLRFEHAAPLVVQVEVQ